MKQINVVVLTDSRKKFKEYVKAERGREDIPAMFKYIRIGKNDSRIRKYVTRLALGKDFIVSKVVDIDNFENTNGYKRIYQKICKRLVAYTKIM